MFYAGHGLQIKGLNYFPAVDSEITSEYDVPTQNLSLGTPIHHFVALANPSGRFVIVPGPSNPKQRTPTLRTLPPPQIIASNLILFIS